MLSRSTSKCRIIHRPSGRCADDRRSCCLPAGSCGDDQGVDFNQRVDLINASGKALMIENSNQGFGNPQRGDCKGNMQCPGCNNSVVKNGCGRGNPNNTLAPGWCPYNMFRTCGDIGPDFGGVMAHLHSTIPYLDMKDPISRPGCWAYPYACMSSFSQ